jgi:hypothetical protein
MFLLNAIARFPKFFLKTNIRVYVVVSIGYANATDQRSVG